MLLQELQKSYRNKAIPLKLVDLKITTNKKGLLYEEAFLFQASSNLLFCRFTFDFSSDQPLLNN